MCLFQLDGGDAELHLRGVEGLLDLRDGLGDDGLDGVGLDRGDHLLHHGVKVDEHRESGDGDGLHQLLQGRDELTGGGDHQLGDGAGQDGGEHLGDAGAHHQQAVVEQQGRHVGQHRGHLTLRDGLGQGAKGGHRAVGDQFELVLDHAVHGVRRDAAGEQVRHLGHVAGVHAVRQLVGLVQGAAPPIHLVVGLSQRAVEARGGELARCDFVAHVGVEALHHQHEGVRHWLEDHRQHGAQHGGALVGQEGVDGAADGLNDLRLELLLLLEHRADQVLHGGLDAVGETAHRGHGGDPRGGAGALHGGADGLADEVHGHVLGGALHDVSDNLVDDVAVQQVQD
eukprot:Colp12_sorted_trinity150504_noHs@1882